MPASINLSEREVGKLRAYVVENKIKLETTKQNEVLRVKTGGLFMVLYTSGSLVYEESEQAAVVLDHVLETRKGTKYYIGSDETGKGEWYGPLVVVGTLMSTDQIKELRKLGVKDSKLLTLTQIKRLADKMLKIGIIRTSRVISPERYNKMFDEFAKEGKNSNDILAWAHSEVVKDLVDQAGTFDVEVIIDKFDSTKTDSRLSSKERLRRVDQTKVKVIQKTKGESEMPVAAASVIAKSIFEDEVAKLSDQYRIDLKSTEPKNIPKDILKMVTKTNFKNIRELIS
jgi:ribonuclease HIII